MRNYNWNIVTNKLFKVKFVADFRKQATVARRMQRWIGEIDKSRAEEGWAVNAHAALRLDFVLRSSFYWFYG